MNTRAARRIGRSLLFSAFAAGLITAAQAADQAAPDTRPALSFWAAERVASRPGVPPLETRSQQGALEADPALATLVLLGLHVPVLPQDLDAEGPQPLALAAEETVYTVGFAAADGSRQQFAAHYRPDDARPLYLFASGYAASPDATFEQAF